MHIVHVHVHVKEDQLEAFKEATLKNATESVKEPGIARFDVIQQQNDPTRFVLVEVYHQEEGTVSHKETEHYQEWRDVVGPMMAQSRSAVVFDNIFPEEAGWEMPS